MQQNTSLTPALIRQRYYSRNIMIYTVLIGLVVLFIGFFAAWKYQDYSNKTMFIDTIDQKMDEAAITENDISTQKIEVNKEYDTVMKDVKEAFSVIFPSSENYTELVREFDNLFKNLDTGSNPAVVTSIKFDKPVQGKTTLYKVLPFTVNMNVTKTNFDAFLKYVYTSGDMKNKTRLIDIKSFSLTMPDDKSTNKTLVLTVKMEAYMK